MYDKNKILTGLAVFVVFMTYPFWNNIGSAAYKAPEVEKPKIAKDCVESVAYMRTEHMQMLNEWRDEVVRDGVHEYHSKANHKVYMKSLTKTCMNCHENKDQFCDKCHATVSVNPYCWDCHVDPKGEKK
ncbi:MAG: cytochrome C [Deltaproteobacteria bacterium]|nr:cytochrome C [Deltaproteobacteria bacterium]